MQTFRIVELQVRHQRHEAKCILQTYMKTNKELKEESETTNVHYGTSQCFNNNVMFICVFVFNYSYFLVYQIFQADAFQYVSPVSVRYYSGLSYIFSYM